MSFFRLKKLTGRVGCDSHATSRALLARGRHHRSAETTESLDLEARKLQRNVEFETEKLDSSLPDNNTGTRREDGLAAARKVLLNSALETRTPKASK